MTCNCGTEARFVINGRSESLQYWFCPNCRDVANEKYADKAPLPAPQQINQAVDQWSEYMKNQRQYLPLKEYF